MQTQENIIIEFLLMKYPDLIAIYLFGSSASETQNIESDIDLAIFPVKKLDKVELWMTSQQLAGILKCDVDLVDLRNASTVMRMQIISSSKCFYESNRFQREIFEDYVFSSYARLNEERKEIIKDIETKGTVYG